jgi:hypothetical protein
MTVEGRLHRAEQSLARRIATNAHTIGIAAIVVVIALAFAIAALGVGGKGTVDHKKAEQFVYSAAATIGLPRPSSVACPSNVTDSVGKTFDCRVVVNGARRTATLRILGTNSRFDLTPPTFR